jgi:four helix bundle protein
LALGTWHLAITEDERLKHQGFDSLGELSYRELKLQCFRGQGMKDFRDLKVWEKAHRLTLNIYVATSSFPKEELYGLTSQIRRCSASIAANIAEGCGRRGNGEFHRFLQIASGSASELDYHLLLANDLRFLKQTQHDELSKQLLEVRRMLTALIVKVETERVSTDASRKSLGAKC